MSANTKKHTVVIGLTGSIGMGKSTAAKILHNFGIPVYSADTATHSLLEKNKQAAKKIALIFPEGIKKGKIDRKSLGNIVFYNPQALKSLEKIIHPLEKKEEQAFIKKARKNKQTAVVLEIPLLFETKREKHCDIIICVTASKSQQSARVLSRRGNPADKLKKIIKLQLSDKEKRRRSTYVVNTGKNLAETKRQLSIIWKKVQEGCFNK